MWPNKPQQEPRFLCIRISKVMVNVFKITHNTNKRWPGAWCQDLAATLAAMLSPSSATAPCILGVCPRQFPHLKGHGGDGHTVPVTPLSADNLLGGFIPMACAPARVMGHHLQVGIPVTHNYAALGMKGQIAPQASGDRAWALPTTLSAMAPPPCQPRPHHPAQLSTPPCMLIMMTMY